ncbi:hypothetical protein COCVIDRAFT_27161 [Bipolaris victoriae FI3]|uniref:Uncharacterized protein n=1 Tax=Bipolaris victoriae (strain FI3) TaxID=930091 RepID=W7EKR5_BIPV3|nr:hypothetical protein COCVIDRAFT_27161 [Bipolaris victoriae FI3]
MSNITKAAGLLSDLQKLDEAGRDRILDLLSVEAVKDVLKASLRQHDRGEDSVVPQNLPATENSSGTIQEQEERPAKQARQITTLRYRKRARIEKENPRGRLAMEKQVIEIVSDQENDKNKNNKSKVRRSTRLERYP